MDIQPDLVDRPGRKQGLREMPAAHDTDPFAGLLLQR
jgi:hypothetical protein